VSATTLSVSDSSGEFGDLLNFLNNHHWLPTED